VAILPAGGDPPPPDSIEAAARALRAGQLVAVPTDTVYGLACDPFHTGAADRLFAAKRRPRDVQLPVLVADEEQALGLTIGVPESARALMDRFWPGALTVVLPRNPDVGADLGSDEATVGVRCPDHHVPRALCAAVGPLATTSANLHSEATLPTPELIEAEFGELVAVVLDAGPCTGDPSTVVDCTGAEVKLLRAGRIPWDDVLEAVVDR
jgi:tRNA threonylcarbamoyl adenosine modification protein (Sua5/YciO/YrdC/YwlC family)